MGKPKAPPPPDYAAAAQQQGEANLNSTLATNYLNQVNQVGPNGSLTFSYDTLNGRRLPDGTIIPATTATTTLSPEQQQLQNQNNQISTNLNDLAIRGIGYVDQASSSPIDTSGLPLLQGGPQVQQVDGNVQTRSLQDQYDFSNASQSPTFDDFATDRDRVTEALLSRARPELDRQRAAREATLANQGLNMGSEAYSREQDQLGRNENDAYFQSILAGTQEQQRQFSNALNLRNQGIGEAIAQGDLFNQAQTAGFGQDLAALNASNAAKESLFNQGLASNQFNNQARAQGLQELDYLKNQPLNLLNALRSGNQVSLPQFSNQASGAQFTPPPIYAAANDRYAAEQANYQSRLGGFNSLLGGLGALGGAAIGKFG